MASQTAGSQLLSSGTNDFEIIEFTVAGQHFGVNVSKVKQIVQFDSSLLTKAPMSHPEVMGLFLFRGTAVTLVDLRKALDLEPQETAIPLVLVTEFDDETTAFLIDGVNRIHRVSWSLIQPIGSYLGCFTAGFTGSINIEDREILIVDLEQIIAGINPEKRLDTRLDGKPEPAESKSLDLSTIKIILAEDSSFMRKGMTDALQKQGFAIAGAFDNGLSAYEFIEASLQRAKAEGKGFDSIAGILITDIEMPKMNGITLAKSVRELGLAKLPIVVFSSIVNKQMVEMAKAAGVSSFISKPKLEELRDLIIANLAKAKGKA